MDETHTVSLELIENSAKELKTMVQRFGLKNVVVPRMGCGNGGLRWEDVKKIVGPILDDRFTIVSFDDEN
jgi:O-acetyl-ADP-ribose deacetylase (regulator of RNase III)